MALFGFDHNIILDYSSFFLRNVIARTPQAPANNAHAIGRAVLSPVLGVEPAEPLLLPFPVVEEAGTAGLLPVLLAVSVPLGVLEVATSYLSPLLLALLSGFSVSSGGVPPPPPEVVVSVVTSVVYSGLLPPGVVVVSVVDSVVTVEDTVVVSVVASVVVSAVVACVVV